MATFSPIYGVQDDVHERAGATVIALHCSGATGAMWRDLADQLAGIAHVTAPALYGAADGPVWPGERAFTLADEAAPIVAAIDAADRLVHLVGHSYGGAVALHAALVRPRHVASLTLYEPACFQLLQPADGIEYAEIVWLAKNVAAMMARGDARGAMKRFVDYWNGRNSWDALSSDAQAALLRWAPKAPLDFHALLERPMHGAAYDQLQMPCRIFVGEHAPAPTVEIANILCAAMPMGHQTPVEGAGHMAPISHAGNIAQRIADHVRSVLPRGVERSTASAHQAA